MIDADLRRAVVSLHTKGMGKRAIARALGLSRNTVRDIIKTGGEVNLKPRRDAIEVDAAELARLHRECSGWKERMWEKLVDETGLAIGYSTLTRKVRDLGLGAKPRAAHVGDTPGAEMQHDTSPYRLKLGDRFVMVIGSSLYFRYSKQVYVKFYRSFDRFRMKCFLHEALIFMRYAAAQCIVDNTNLAVLRGTGKNAIFVPEMVEFARRYGFDFVAHEKGHANRKAGEERGFFTVESNFFPGRSFASLDDLNAQAFRWATELRANKERSKSKIIPAVAFEYETAFLKPVLAELPPPYRVHDRLIDQYGWVAFAGNYYWTPGEARGAVKVLEYAHEIKIYQSRRQLAVYPLPPEGTKNQIFPEGRPHVPFLPRHRERPSEGEEAQLRQVSPTVAAFLDLALTGLGTARHRYVRGLTSLRRRLAPELFERVVARALHYRAVDLQDLEEIALLLVRDDADFLPDLSCDGDYEERQGFLEGRLTDQPDIDPYQQMLEDGDE